MYELTFYEALKELFDNGKPIRGEDFPEGMFLKLDSLGDVVSVYTDKFHRTYNFSIHQGLKDQKYKTFKYESI